MKVLLLICTLGFALAACTKESIHGSGDVMTQTRNVAPFTRVETHYDISANITYGPTREVVVTGYRNLLEILETDVENGVLKLRFNRRYNHIKNGNVVANITVPVIEKATIHGSRGITVSNFAAGAFFEALIHGSGKITVRNSAFQQASAVIHGSGDIEARGLQAREAVAQVYGSGDVFLSVTERLKATIHGSGDVRYWGDPTVESHIHGSGRVRKQ